MYIETSEFEKENELLRKRNEKLRRLKREEEREDRHRHAQHRKYLSHPDLPLGGTVFQRDQLTIEIRHSKIPKLKLDFLELKSQFFTII